MILTIDLGTSATKTMVWGPAGPIASARAPVATQHPEPGWAEQDPADWWTSVIDAVAALRDDAGTAWEQVAALGFSAARETFVPVTAAGDALGPAIVWSDRRADKEMAALATASGGPDAFHHATGVIPDGGCTAAKIAWLADNDSERLDQARWVLAPRDLVVLRLTGTAVTDTTLSSRTGLWALDGEVYEPSGGRWRHLLPPVVPPATTAGPLGNWAAERLHLTAGIPVVVGAGDRPSEVLGTGADPTQPMVSWGTTANLSIPVPRVAGRPPAGVSISEGARGGQLLEAGLSASGAALDWLARLCATDVAGLVSGALASPPGARGVVALPWLHGARAPWWRREAAAAFLHVTAAHGPGDLARAVIEGVAFDLARCLDTIGRDEATALMAAGGGAASEVWLEVLAAVTGLPVVARSTPEAASAGACLLTAEATGASMDLAEINPVAHRVEPDPSLADRYGALRRHHEDTAIAVLPLEPLTVTTDP